MEDDTDKLLSILQAHGQQFMSLFDTPTGPKKRRRGDDHEDGVRPVKQPTTEDSETEEQWKGFGWLDQGPDSTSSPESDDATNDDLEHDDDDDGFTAGSSHAADVVVFSDSRQKPPGSMVYPKTLKKSFMSSKVSKVTLTPTHGVSAKKPLDGEMADERTNAQNDALLHRLVHSKLLSGSLNPDLNLTHAQRGKTLAGRVLELNGSAKLGKGEASVREAERNKASKRVREGLLRKKMEREQEQLEEAKNLGNYHPTLKRLYSSDSASTRRKRRERGLGIGIGKFSGGTLKLSRDEIDQATGAGSSRGTTWRVRGQSRRR